MSRRWVEGDGLGRNAETPGGDDFAWPREELRMAKVEPLVLGPEMRVQIAFVEEAMVVEADAEQLGQHAE